MIEGKGEAIRMQAEWEDHSSVLVAFPDKDTDWNVNLDEARNQFLRLISAMAVRGEKVILIAQDSAKTEQYVTDYFQNEIGNRGAMDQIEIVEIPINDTWVRDYGPITVVRDSIGSDGKNSEELRRLDFGFNAWGGKFEYEKDNQVNANLRRLGIIPDSEYEDCNDFILEGGSIECDGKGTILTTSECLLNPNRNPRLAKEDIEDKLRQKLGAKRILWLDHGHLIGDDTDSHIDTLCRFAPGDVIFYTDPGDKADPQHDGLERMHQQLLTFRTAEGNPYTLIELPVPDPVYGKDGARLGATYANYLVTNKYIYMPTYRQPQKDRLAAMTLQSVYHDRKVVAIDCTVLVTQGGSLHCSTMQYG